MANTCNEIARRLLDCCLRGEAWQPELLHALLEDEALLRIVVEGMADRFEPRLCATYAGLFSEAIAQVDARANAAELVARYRRVAARRTPAPDDVERVFVLSRVTLGADVAVTSVLLDAAKRRYPEAAMCLVGGRKNWELFAADPRVRHVPLQYRQGPLRQRLSIWDELRELVTAPRSIVIDPDSRLTQSGLLPVCPEENYFFFESRGYGGEGDEPLPELARRWAAEILGIADGRPYVALRGVAEPGPRPVISVSFGVGENLAKRIGDPFETELLRYLGGHGATIWIDIGAGGEEAERVRRAIQESGVAARTWEGSFAGFASIISRSDLYVGYDSAGQHVAAACGVPLVSVFAGFASPRMFARWRPAGNVLRVDDPEPARVLPAAISAIEGASERRGDTGGVDSAP